MSEASTKKPRRSWLMGASLLLNLFFIGLLIGGFFIKGGMHKGSRDAHGTMHVLKDIVPEAREGELKALFEAQRQAWRRPPGDESRRAEREALDAAMRADPFDADALVTLQLARMTRRDEQRAASMRRFADFLATLSPDERTAFADAMKERRQRWKDRRKD